MSIHIPSTGTSTAFSVTVTKGASAYTENSPAGASSSATATQTESYVYNVDQAAMMKSMDTSPNAPLSTTEIEQLHSAYLGLGRDAPVWKEIDTLLTEELSGNDRTNFLAVIADAGSSLSDFVHQVGMLEGEDRSLYLSTALRNGNGENLDNLVDVTKKLSGTQLTRFLTTADSLGRTVESVRAGELQNFIKAVAEAPNALDDLIEKISVLDEEDRALFLEAAALSGDHLEQFIDTSDLLEGEALTTFFEITISAGKGLSNLLGLTRDLGVKARTEFFTFANSLHSGENQAKGEVENFLLATRGDEDTLPGLTAAARSLGHGDRANFLSLAAGAGDTLERLTALVGRLDPDSGEQSDFLTAAVKAEDGFKDLLQVTEQIGGDERADVLSYATTLTFVDLTNFISAAKSNPSQAGRLAETAGELDGKNQSYLLYAASLHPDNASDLISMTQRLNGEERDDFLFTAANIEKSNTDGINTFVNTVEKLSGDDRRDFLARERLMSSGGPENALASEYVYLKSVFDEDAFEAVIGTGQDIEEVLSDFEDMGAVQRQNFFSVLDKAGKEMVGDLMSVISRLDEDRSQEFMAYASTLGKESLSDLITAADLALDGDGRNFDTFDTLMETAQSLDPAVDQDFLSAAAKSGKHLEKFLELTNEFKGFIQADFLSIADHMAERGEDLLGQFLNTTEYLVDRGGLSPRVNFGGLSEITPDTLIQDGVFQGGVGIEGFFKSTNFLIGVGAKDSLMNDWFNTWRGIPRQV
ncbi:MAG: hypothetical protein V6Z89_21045 [Desulfobacter sp.]